ncbi:MAG: L-seryl-tRNA(Sec) selenium transferase [Acidobacteriia bacterium]|nr:L-seryl-tRNA(Sec) selenium transferase [Terriglobia bacterium]
MTSSIHRQIPPVDTIINSPRLIPFIQKTSRSFIIGIVRRVLNVVRQEISSNTEKEISTADLNKIIFQKIHEEFLFWTEPTLKRVINATGVILHTNLGRAPINQDALEYATEIASNYSNLEFDLVRRVREKRDNHISRILENLLDCEQAIVVNNNAAAVLLVLNSLGSGGEVLISRGEMIEIGDSFRIPDILQQSGTILREIGTTNKTRLADYEQNINENTKLILKVHPSNFKISGFTSQTTLKELSSLSSKHSLPLVDDLGSGCLIDLTKFGIEDEPNPHTSLVDGADIVCFSGDKLLGGPQAGIIAGKSKFINKIRKNPLFRILRLDKVTLAILESTLLTYLKQCPDQIPVVQMIYHSEASIEKRVLKIIQRFSNKNSNLNLNIVKGFSVIGGGSAPSQKLGTWLISLRSKTHSTSKIDALLRSLDPPILARFEMDTVLLDLRTVFPQDDSLLAQSLENLAKS